MDSPFRKHAAYALDAAVAAFVVLGVVLVFTIGLGGEKATFLSASKFFTFQSNVLVGLCCLVCLPFDILVAIGKKSAKPALLSLLLRIASVGTALTFLTVICFLGPTMGYPLMFESGNLYLHLIVPLLILVRVIFFELEAPWNKFRTTFFGIIHMVAYGVFYLVNLAIHNGYGTAAYDWYGFGAYGLGIGFLFFFGSLLLTYGISFLIYFAQKKFIAFSNKQK